MRSIRVIPCLDVDAGRVVKGVNFVGLRDAGDPVELAARYGEAGGVAVVFLGLTASSDARRTMVDVVRRTAEEVFIPLTVGGGVRSVDDAGRLLRAGADKVGVNTAAVLTPTLSAPARSRRLASSTVRTPPPTVRGMNTSSAVRVTTSTIVSRASDEAVMSRNTTSSAPASS